MWHDYIGLIIAQILALLTVGIGANLGLWTGQHYVQTNLVFQNFPGLQCLIASSLVPKVRII